MCKFLVRRRCLTFLVTSALAMLWLRSGLASTSTLPLLFDTLWLSVSLILLSITVFAGVASYKSHDVLRQLKEVIRPLTAVSFWLLLGFSSTVSSALLLQPDGQIAQAFGYGAIATAVVEALVIGVAVCCVLRRG